MNWIIYAISILRNVVSTPVVNVIKDAILEAATHGSWSNGEKTAFVMDKAREAAKVSENTFDDLAVELLIKLYVRYFKQQGKLTQDGKPATLPASHPV